MKRISLVLLLVACTKPATMPATPKSRNVTVVAQGLEVPWSIAFAPDGRMFVTERPGRVRVIESGRLRAEPLLSLTDVVATGEAGLMGLALHPDFARNRFVYLCYATSGLTDVVVRYRDTGASLVEPKTLVQNIPAARFHAGCRLKFGPDRKLYITTGDATDRQIAQDLHSLGGKILRINDDGTIPADNPFPGSPIWSCGNRNPQGIDWDPKSGLLFETEHGPSGFDGGVGGDEVNIIERGKNYGWPVIHHDERRAGMESPLRQYTPACAPASAAFWRGDLYFGCLRGENLHRLVLDANDRRKIVREEELFTDLGRIREVAVGPDGALYFTTSNRDGRGRPAEEDDRIFRLAPP
jgi:glucose/arabinose dehydrogenase